MTGHTAGTVLLDLLLVALALLWVLTPVRGGLGERRPGDAAAPRSGPSLAEPEKLDSWAGWQVAP